MTTTKTVGLVIAGVIVSVLFSGMMIANFAGEKLGGVYNVTERNESRLVVGGGSALTFFKMGTCNLSQSAAGSHAATTSKELFCAVTGVQANDTVIVDLPRTAGFAGGLPAGFVVNTAYATTTDVIAVSVVNLTGAASSSYAQATTSASYLIFR